MKKRNLILMVAAAVMLLASCAEKKTYTINGIIEEEASVIENGADTVFIYNLETREKIDSVVIVDKKFSYTGNKGDYKALMLLHDGIACYVIPEKDLIKVNLSTSFAAQDGVLNKSMDDYYRNAMSIKIKFKERIGEIDETQPIEAQRIDYQKLQHETSIRLDSLAKSFIKEHSNDIAGAIIFDDWADDQKSLTAQEFNRQLSLFNRDIISYKPIQERIEYFKELSKTSAGKPFIDFTVENGNPDGTTVSLSDYIGKGKYILVDYWASWCMPCRAQIPHLKAVYEKYKNDNFDIVSIAVWDDRDKSIKALEKEKLPWPQILDAKKEHTNLYSIKVIPQIMLFSPDGTLLARDLEGESLDKEMAKFIEKK